MKILLTGGSGFIGRHVLRALEAEKHEIVLATRRSGVDFSKMQSADDWMTLLNGVDVVINCVGIIVETSTQTFADIHVHAPSALFHACVRAGVKRVIHISALGADELAFTPYQSSKRAGDEVLRHLPVEWFVLRPSLVYGEGGTSAALFQRLAGLPLIPLLGHGSQWVQPVHVDDLVETVMRCLRAHPAHRTLDVVGAYPIRFVEWLQAMRQARGKRKAPTLAIPFSFVLFNARWLRFLIPLSHPDNIRMLQRGNVADVLPLAEFLGHMPRSVEAF
jgi:uncharacterized protein YbjT (DUF2867 family)